jgi:hypothetical protein
VVTVWVRRESLLGYVTDSPLEIVLYIQDSVVDVSHKFINYLHDIGDFYSFFYRIFLIIISTIFTPFLYHSCSGEIYKDSV